ncbi:MAG: iron-containing alcohol dehydrogenase [Phycisphaerae bacterium]
MPPPIVYDGHTMHEIIGQIFGRTFDCECGRTHSIEPREIAYREDAVVRLPEIAAECCRGRAVCVLSDARTRRAAGEGVAEVLKSNGWDVHELIVPDPVEGKSPVCDDVTKARLAEKLPDVDLIVPVGAGVVSDLGKWLAFERGMPFLTFATAASMNGYASANVAPAVDGVKTLVRARPPVAVVSSPSVLADAPYELTAAGFGDVLAKSVSSADWKLNAMLFGEYYCARSVSLIAEIEPLYLDNPEAIRDRRREAVEALYEALLLTGAAMTMAETSSPASGGEHLLSHALDMLAVRDGASHDLHGRQVGVGTVLASEVYRRVLAVESPQPVAQPTDVDSAFWGGLTGAVAPHYAEKLPKYQAAAEVITTGNTWDELRSALSRMVRPPRQLHDALRRASAAATAADIGCEPQHLLEAFTHAHELRSRFTVLDLARLLGVMPAGAAEIVSAWT